ncbi:MAG: protein kinase [Planctomycetes bacterium]|nr:protein kinase [Planctomycetota bacterium]
MADSTSLCPTPEVLEGIAIGKCGLPDMDHHVANCKSCREMLQRIREDNAFLGDFAVGGALPIITRPQSTHEIEIPGYEIVREIHRGGQGVVYQALQKSTKRAVAIKVMKQGPFATLADRARFDREIETLGRMNHPNIVAVHDAGVVTGFHYFVMNFVDGKTLDETITPPNQLNRGRIPESIGLFIKACDAVHAAHLRGVIHRDLKPSNIRVDASGEPHILDFGLAKSVDAERDSAMTQSGQFVGSLPWASPEQVEGMSSRIDLRTDVYSLGAILFQMLTSALPFDVGSNLRDAFESVLLEEPPRPSAVMAEAGGPRLDDELDTIVLKCLSKDRDRRYQSAAELSRDLRRYLVGEPIEAKRDSALYVLRKTMRRYKLRVAVAGALVVIFGAFGVVMALMYRHSSRMERDAVRSAASFSNLLTISNIEQGQMAAVMGNVHQAEQLLWTEFLSHRDANDSTRLQLNDPPGSPRAYWALLDLYRRNPCRMTVALAPGQLSIATLADDDQSLWVARGDGLIQRIDAAGRILDSFRINYPSEPGTPGVDPTGLFVTHQSSLGVTVWKRNNGDQPILNLRAGPNDVIGDFCVSRSGSRLAAIVNGAATVWTLDSPAVLLKIQGTAPDFTAIAISVDGRLMAARDRDGGIRVWDVDKQDCVVKHMAPPARSGAITLGELCFSPDGSLLADGWAESEGRIWNLSANPPTLTQLNEQPGTYRVHGFSPDGRLLAIGDPGGTLRIFDAQSGERIALRMAHQSRLYCIAFTRDGRGIWTGSENELRLWDVNRDEGVSVVRRDDDLFHSADISLDNRTMIAGGRNGRFHRIDCETLVATSEPLGNQATISSVSFSPDGRRMAAATYGNDAFVWDRQSPDAPPLRIVHPRVIRFACFSPNSNRIATSCEDAVVRVWRCNDGGLEMECKDLGEPAPHIAFDPSGRNLAMAVRSGALIIWNLESRECETWSPANRRPLRVVRYSGDGRWLYSAGAGRVIQKWDTKHRSVNTELSGHTQEIYCMDISPDGQLIASGDSAGAILLWNPELPRPLASLDGHTGSVMSLRFSSDGRKLISAALDGTIRVWNLDYYARYVRSNLEAQLQRLGAESLDIEQANAWRKWASP